MRIKLINNHRKSSTGVIAGLLFAAGVLGVSPAMASKTIINPADTTVKANSNPIITHKYTADPAAIVHKDKVYLYAGHDEAPARREGYVMNEWLVFSSPDMVNWTEHAVPLAPKDFAWSSGDAWASHVVERNGKFYWYATVTHKDIPGKAVGVAVSDSPTGPFKDARGSALITNDMTTDVDISWDDIDPAVFIDDDGQAYIFWGNTVCHYAKLKDNMTELDGPIKTIKLPNFTEAPWVHKHKGKYYLSYAYQFPEKTAYAMSRSIEGPWEYKGILNELAGNSNTNHQAIIDFKGNSYFIYHNGGIQPDGGSFRRSVCIDRLYYNKDGSMKRVVMTTEGIKPAK
ncbi:glycoside hydrolase family 43 protein [Pontibacter silvestris]|uniref:Glycoside hydrolase family 43 protein n=1 Tax=Pontibacter silvestris TaxID=2305183 RepID=A0ABW4X2A3_9BACT|nr:glycoside hydrolase family 43 protein [Pontibacter silvestris]MCC9134899.1 glycoside hydrolase family 43 protein [Pontibacter silvestris]